MVQALRVVVACLLAAVVMLGLSEWGRAEPSGEPLNQIRPEQYTRSPIAKQFWGLSLGTEATTELVPVATASTTPQLFLCGTQVLVSCVDSRQSSAHRGGAVATWLQADGATVDVGVQDTSYDPDIWTFGDGTGDVTDEDDGGTTLDNHDGVSASFLVPSGTSQFNLLSCWAFKGTDPAASYRVRGCSGAGNNPGENFGRPCAVNADCFDGSTCSAAVTPRGAYLGLTATSTTVSCTVQVAR